MGGAQVTLEVVEASAGVRQGAAAGGTRSGKWFRSWGCCWAGLRDAAWDAKGVRSANADSEHAEAVDRSPVPGDDAG